MIVSVMNPKGGTGKSTVGKFAMDHFIRTSSQKLSLLDVDRANKADVAEAFKKSQDRITVMAYRLEDIDDFDHFLKLLASSEKENGILLINHGAANDLEFEKFGKALARVCMKINADFRTLWVTDTDATCLEQLQKFVADTGGYPKITVVKNLDKGTQKDFERIMPDDALLGLPSVLFPVLPNMLRQQLKRPVNHAIHELEEAMDFCEYYLVEEYIDKGRDVVAKAIEMAKTPEKPAA